MRISLSTEYQLPKPRPPILRLPMASTSSLPPSCFTFDGSAGSTVGSGGLTSSLVLSLLLSLSESEVVLSVCGALVDGVSDGFELSLSCEKLTGAVQNANNKRDSSKGRNFINISYFLPGNDFLMAIIRLAW